MLLLTFNNFWGSLRSPWKLTIHFEFDVQGHCSIKIQITILWNDTIIITRCIIKKNVSKLKNSWKKSMAKGNLHSFNYALLTKVQYLLTIARNITRTILVIWSKHRFFWHLSCLKSLRSNIPIILLSCVDYFFIIVFAYGSNRF